MHEIGSPFPSSYEGSRDRFRRSQSPLQQHWANARPVSHSCNEHLCRHPRVAKSEAGDSYHKPGDMIEWIHTFVASELPDRLFCTALLEFGTLGDSLLARLRSLRAMMLENQMFGNGAPRRARWAIKRQLHVLLFPQEEERQAEALSDARQALLGVLAAEGSPSSGSGGTIQRSKRLSR